MLKTTHDFNVHIEICLLKKYKAYKHSLSQQINPKTIIIKKSIIPLNNSNISGTISFTQKKDSVHLEAHVYLSLIHI